MTTNELNNILEPIFETYREFIKNIQQENYDIGHKHGRKETLIEIYNIIKNIDHPELEILKKFILKNF